MTNQKIKSAYRITSKGQLRSFGQKYSHMQRGDSRPVLNYDLYRKARDAGKTNEEIKQEYKLANSKQITGLSLAYLKWAKERKKPAKRKPRKKN